MNHLWRATLLVGLATRIVLLSASPQGAASQPRTEVQPTSVAGSQGPTCVSRDGGSDHTSSGWDCGGSPRNCLANTGFAR